MDDLREKRIFESTQAAKPVYVSCGTGVIKITVSDGRIGQFSLFHSGRALDITNRSEELIVATDTDILRFKGSAFESLGFGVAVAIGVRNGSIIAASPTGHIALFESGEWREIDHIDTDIRSIDGDLIATDDGVYRYTDREINRVGLAHVNDVSGVGLPFAVTDEGLFWLGNGWMKAQTGHFRCVARAHSEPGTLLGACAATESSIYRFNGDQWLSLDLEIDGRIAALCLDRGPNPRLFVSTDSGLFSVFDPDGLENETDDWDSQHLGVNDVTGIAITEL